MLRVLLNLMLEIVGWGLQYGSSRVWVTVWLPWGQVPCRQITYLPETVVVCWRQLYAELVLNIDMSEN
jgi:hypothetical protein